MIAVALVALPLVPAHAQTDGGGIQVNAQGVGKPPSGAGMATKAALGNSKCNAEAIQGWGSVPMITTTGGPYCVAPAPKSNGGATSRGVTGSAIKVVVVLPWPETNGTGATNDAGSKNRATGQPPTVQAVVLDTWAALAHVYETWGRKVEFTFVTASGLDETSQRADVVKVEQEKPMFVINTDARGLGVLATTLAKDKYVVYSLSTTPKQAAALAPYMWGGFNSEANLTNAAEFIGKQVVGGKAEFAGDSSMHSQPRKFGLVYAEGSNLDSFTSTFRRYKARSLRPRSATPRTAHRWVTRSPRTRRRRPSSPS